MIKSKVYSNIIKLIVKRVVLNEPINFVPVVKVLFLQSINNDYHADYAVMLNFHKFLP